MNMLIRWGEGADPPKRATLHRSDVESAVGGGTAAFLGRGSFGETWKVTPTQGRPYAIKFVLDANYPRAYLAREIAGLTRVGDSRVVKILRARTVTLPFGERQAIEFEFIDGGDVSAKVAAGAWPEPAAAASFSRELLGAVAAMHATNTVHRDIKPGNIALRGDAWDAPVLLDLGLAKLLDVETMTRYPALMGTAAYMAPEQLRGEPARKLADVWAVGVVSYVLLAGEHPFLDRGVAATIEQTLSLIEHGPKPLPATAPPGLVAVVERLLQFEPHRRGSADRAYRELGGRP